MSLQLPPPPSPQLATYDPVRAVPLQKHVTSKLQECVGILGEPLYAALMHSVDLVVREQLVEFLPPDQARTLLALTDGCGQ